MAQQEIPAPVGDGFRADYLHLRLLVEEKEDHWEAGVYDLEKREWFHRQIVADPEEGKKTAFVLACLYLGRGVDHPPLIEGALAWKAYSSG